MIGGKNQKDVAHALGISPQAVTEAKNRGGIPDRWFDIIKKEYGITKEELCENPEEKLIRTYGRNPVSLSINLPYRSDSPVLNQKTNNKIAARIEPGEAFIKQLLMKKIDAQAETISDKHHEDSATPISDMLLMTSKVLESNTIYRSALASNVRAFYQSVVQEEEMKSLNDKMEMMQEQMARMEKMLAKVTAAMPQKREEKEGSDDTTSGVSSTG